MVTRRNIAFIDGQNLHLGTTQNGWKINYSRFRTYLREKYHVQEASYFLGYTDETQQDLYKNLQKSGFIVCFREHHSALKTSKKGNVDTDIVFEVMKLFIEQDDFGKVILVSGDGDYKKLVDYLIKHNKLEKILFPNRKFASSLYRTLPTKYYDYLESKSIKAKIAHS